MTGRLHFSHLGGSKEQLVFDPAGAATQLAWTDNNDSVLHCEMSCLSKKQTHTRWSKRLRHIRFDQTWLMTTCVRDESLTRLWLAADDKLHGTRVCTLREWLWLMPCTTTVFGLYRHNDPHDLFPTTSPNISGKILPTISRRGITGIVIVSLV